MKAYFRAPRIGDHMMVRTLLLTGEDMGNGKGPQDDCLVGALPDGEYFFDWAHEHPTLDRSVRAKEVSAGYMQVEVDSRYVDGMVQNGIIYRSKLHDGDHVGRSIFHPDRAGLPKIPPTSEHDAFSSYVVFKMAAYQVFESITQCAAQPRAERGAARQHRI